MNPGVFSPIWGWAWAEGVRVRLKSRKIRIGIAFDLIFLSRSIGKGTSISQGVDSNQMQGYLFPKSPYVIFSRLLKKSLSTSGCHSCGSRNPVFQRLPGLRLSPEWRRIGVFPHPLRRNISHFSLFVKSSIPGDEWKGVANDQLYHHINLHKSLYKSAHLLNPELFHPVA